MRKHAVRENMEYKSWISKGEKLSNVCCTVSRGIILALGTVIMFYLFAAGLFISQTFYDYELGYYPGNPFPFLKDNWVLLIICLAGLLAAAALAVKAAESKHGKVLVYVLLIGEMLFTFFLSLWWIDAIQTVPSGDPGSILYYAQQFAAGNFADFIPDSYLTYYPQQLGLTTVISLLSKLGSKEAWQYYQIINAVCVPLAGLAGFLLVKLCWNNIRIQVLYLLLMGTCIPFIFYAPYMYGEVVSITCCMWACYFAVRIMKGIGKIFSYLMLFLFMGIGIWIRMNSLIIVIAIILCAVLHSLKRKKGKYLLLILPMILAVIIPQVVNQTMYGEYLQDTDSIPALGYVAMGLQDGWYGTGSYNGFNVTVFEDAGYDAKEANRLSAKKIKDILKGYGEHPGEGLSFLNVKILWQWEAPTFMCLLSNGSFGKSIDGLAHNLYFGILREPFFQVLNLYQSFIYFGVLAAFCIFWKKEKRMENLLLAVVFLGGFFFSVIWEAKPRYILPYYVMMIPLAAYGIDGVIAGLYKVTVGYISKRKKGIQAKEGI